MFAFVFYDKEKNKLLSAVDHFGQKQLYFTFHHQEIVISSEITPIVELLNYKRIDRQALYYFAKDNYTDHNNHTFFENLFKLDAGTTLEYDLNTKKKIVKSYLKKTQILIFRP